jgi:phosphatidylserine/phosphatidylglycerophosphate/cardiolipin synthase-like enzyme
MTASRRRVWLLLGLLVIVVIAIGAALVLSGILADALSANEDVPERHASESGRAPVPSVSPVPGGATTNLGSGQASSGAWYELAFTAPKYPDNPTNHTGGIDEKLVALIDRAQQTLDVADYDFDLQNVAQAMARAAQRGVQVRMVTDTDTLTNTKDREIQAAFNTVKGARIPIVDDQRRAIMHDKFVVVDGEWVLTGSWNFTDGDTYRLNNNAIIIHSRQLAANYAGEFEKMFGRKFGASKSAGVPNPVLSFDGARVENSFCPQDKCADQVIRWVNTARQQIHFMAFSFTHDGIGSAMMDRAKAGVPVAGVFEKTGSETKFSEYGRMKQAGLDVLQDGSPWTMHHKVIIIDNHVTIFGSFNFSSNADKDNDENLLIVDDPTIAAAFEAEYQRVRNVALNPPARQR